MNNKRAMYMLAVFCFLFLTLIGYMTYIEFQHSDEYRKEASNPRKEEFEKNIIRGCIYDCNGEVLAYSEDDDGTKVRVYPYENLYSQVIGSIHRSENHYIENRYRSYLMGEDTLTQNDYYFSKMKNSELHGNDVTLTINHELQKTADEAMGDYNGAIVLLDIKTGAVLAMVSKPDYNPYNPLEDEAKDNSIWMPRAIQQTYPPGSTFKTITTACILENGLQDETYNDKDGQYKLNGTTVMRNEYNEYSYGITDLKKAFTVSSNVYFSHLSTMLSNEQLKSTARNFFFEKTIDFDLHINPSQIITEGNEEWSDYERILSSVGQYDVRATPMHMALIAAAIANDGIMPRPYIVSEINSPDEDVFTAYPQSFGKVISKENAQTIKDYMRSVVTEGTGKAASIQGFEVCGKTGTSENDLTEENPDKTHSLFIGFAPYDNPEIAICVIKEYAGFGATYAVPAAKTVMEKYFELYH